MVSRSVITVSWMFCATLMKGIVRLLITERRVWPRLACWDSELAPGSLRVWIGYRMERVSGGHCYTFCQQLVTLNSVMKEHIHGHMRFYADITHAYEFVSENSAQWLATGWNIGARFPAGARIVFFTTTFSLALGAHPSPQLMDSEGYFLCEATDPAPSSGIVMNTWNYTSTPPMYLHDMLLK
jgi:hypothetical protein